MRNPLSTMYQIVGDLLRQSQELKQAQQVGTNQILAKSQTSSSYNVTLTQGFMTEGTAIVVFLIEVTPQNLPAGNMFVSNLTPIIKKSDGSRFSIWDNGPNMNNNIVVIRVDMGNSVQDRWFVAISGNTNTTLNIKFRISSSADMTYNITRYYG